MVLENTLESPLDCKEFKLVSSKGNQFWIFIGRTDAKAKTPILWPHDGINWLFGKTLMLGKIEDRWRRGRWRMRWLDGITNSVGMSLNSFVNCWWTRKPGVLRSMGSQRVGHDWVTELNGFWKRLWKSIYIYKLNHFAVYLKHCKIN